MNQNGPKKRSMKFLCRDTEKARLVAKETMLEIREAMSMKYF